MKTSPGIWAARVLVAFLMAIVVGFGINHLYVDDAFIPELNGSVLMQTVVICTGLVYAMYRLWKTPSNLDRAMPTKQERQATPVVIVRHSFWPLMGYSLKVGFFGGLLLGGSISSFFGLPLLIYGMSTYAIGTVFYAFKIVGVGLISGMLAGGAFGAFNGLLIAWLTWQFFLLPKDASRYQGTVGWVCASMSLLLGISVLVIGARFQSELHGALLPVPFAIPLLPFIAWSASQKVCSWYTSEGNTVAGDVIGDNNL